MKVSTEVWNKIKNLLKHDSLFIFKDEIVKDKEGFFKNTPLVTCSNDKKQIVIQRTKTTSICGLLHELGHILYYKPSFLRRSLYKLISEGPILDFCKHENSTPKYNLITDDIECCVVDLESALFVYVIGGDFKENYSKWMSKEGYGYEEGFYADFVYYQERMNNRWNRTKKLWKLNL